MRNLIVRMIMGGNTRQKNNTKEDILYKMHVGYL